jgi:hypothetical protein
LNRLLAWLREHKNGVAAVVALVVVWRVARFALGSAWVLAGWDDVVEVGNWALERWAPVAAALALVFAAVFVTVRAVIPWLERREQDKRTRSSG